MIYWVLIGITFIFFLYIALKSRTKNLIEHEGRTNSIELLRLVSTLLASTIGGGIIFALIKFGQLSGIIGLSISFVYCMSFIIIGFLSPHIRNACFQMQGEGSESNIDNFSITNALASKFNKVVWSIISAIYVCIYIGFLAGQYVALATIAKSMGLNLDINTMIITCSFFVFLLVSIGGYKAVVHSDVFQLIATVIIILSGLILIYCNGFPSLSSMPKQYWDPFADQSLSSLFVWLSIFILPTLLLRIDHWQRIVTAKNDNIAKYGYFIAGILLLLVFLMLMLVGAYSKLEGYSNPFLIFNKVLINGDLNIVLGRFLYGGILVGFLAALISSADTIINSCVGFITKTLRSWKVIKTNNYLWAIGFYAIVSFCATIMALIKPEIVPLITESFKAVCIFLPSLSVGIILKKPSNFATTLSLISGVIAYLIVWLTWQQQGHWSYLISFFVATITLILGYHIEITKQKSSA